MNWSAFEPRGISVKVRILCWEEEHARLSFDHGGARIGPYGQDARVLGRLFLVGDKPRATALEWQLAPMALRTRHLGQLGSQPRAVYRGRYLGTRESTPTGPTYEPVAQPSEPAAPSWSSRRGPLL